MKQSTWWTVGGIIALIGGFIALFNPFAASFAATFIAAWAFLLGGIFQIVALFDAKGTGNKILLGLFGILSILAGIILFRNPLEGVLTLTVAVALLFIVSGIVRFVMSFQLRGTGGFWLVMISAIISVILGIMILSGFPDTSAYTLGVLLGVELIFDGIALLGLAGSAKSVRKMFEGDA
ncbi:MAG: HdeD family acid-resistance protein [Sphingomonadaceae bacterium]